MKAEAEERKCGRGGGRWGKDVYSLQRWPCIQEGKRPIGVGGGGIDRKKRPHSS